MANLKLVDVSKKFPSGKMALFNTTFSSSDSEFIAITGGPSSGKSTLLRIIAGLEDATSGEIYIGDKMVNDVDTKERDVAMIFSSNTLNPSLTTADNLAYGLKMRNVPNAVLQQRVKIVAEMLGLTEVLYRKPKALTSAQRQLVTYGRAIVREPKLYLLDDPLAGLDEKLRDDMRNILVNLQARVNGTFIYATKNISEALSVATRIVVLKDGFVQQVDTPRNLYDYPANAYVAFFVGSPTINFVQNAVAERGEDGEVYIVFDDKKLPVAQSIMQRWTSAEEYVGTGKKLIVGVRPEDISVDSDGAQLKGAVCGADTADGIDLAEIDISKNVKFTVFCEKPVKGKEHSLAIDLSKIYLFDAKTQLTLLARDEGYIHDPKNTEAQFVPLTKAETEEHIKQFTPPKEKDTKKNR